MRLIYSLGLYLIIKFLKKSYITFIRRASTAQGCSMLILFTFWTIVRVGQWDPSWWMEGCIKKLKHVPSPTYSDQAWKLKPKILNRPHDLGCHKLTSQRPHLHKQMCIMWHGLAFILLQLFLYHCFSVRVSSILLNQLPPKSIISQFA